MATSTFFTDFKTGAGAKLEGYTGHIYLVPSGSTVNNLMPLSEDTGRPGQYFRENVPDGEYKVYVDLDKSGSPVEGDLYKIPGSGNPYLVWHGEKNISDVMAGTATLVKKGLMSVNHALALDKESSFCNKFTSGYIKYTGVSLPAALNIQFSFVLETLVPNAVLLEGQALFWEIITSGGKNYLKSKIGSSYFNNYQELENFRRYDISADIDDSAKTVKIYVNGLKVVDGTYTGTIGTTDFLEIGGDFADANWAHKGYIWDARLNGYLIDNLYPKVTGDTFTNKTANELNDYLTLLKMLRLCSYQLKTVSYDIGGNIYAADIVWADGSAGVLSYGDYNLGALEFDSFEATHVRSGLKAVQPQITRNSDYQVTVIPEIQIQGV